MSILHQLLLAVLHRNLSAFELNEFRAARIARYGTLRMLGAAEP